MHPRSRSAFAAFATALAAVTALGAMAPASVLADGLLAIYMQVGGKCVEGHKPTDQPITVRLLRSDGTTRSTRTDDTTSLEWRVCFSVPVAGSRVRMTTAGSASRTVRIPTLTVKADRVTNVVTGQAPAGGQVSIQYSSCGPGECSPHPSRQRTVDNQGRYRKDLGTGSNPADIDGSDKVEVSYQNNQGDAFTATTRATWMEITAPNKIHMGCQPKGTTTLRLRTSGGTLRASKTLTSTKGCGATDGTFKKNGDALNVHVGDRVTADFAADASLQWPAMAIAAQVGTSSFSVHCLPSVSVMLYLDLDNDIRYIGTTNANGDLSGTLGPSRMFESGDRLELTCETSRGDRVRYRRTLP